jgi:hypothetical protein
MATAAALHSLPKKARCPKYGDYYNNNILMWICDLFIKEIICGCLCMLLVGDDDKRPAGHIIL